jgi:hypothetical protein
MCCQLTLKISRLDFFLKKSGCGPNAAQWKPQPKKAIKQRKKEI